MKRVDDRCMPESFEDVLDMMARGDGYRSCQEEIAGLYDVWSEWRWDELRDLALIFAFRELAASRVKL